MEKNISPINRSFELLLQRCCSKDNKDIQSYLQFLQSTDFARSLLREDHIKELAKITNLQPEMVFALLAMSFRFPVCMQTKMFKKIFEMAIPESKIYTLQQEFIVSFVNEFRDFSFSKNETEATKLFEKGSELNVTRENANIFKRVFDCFMMVKIFPQIYSGKEDSKSPTKTLLKPKKDQSGF